MNFLDVFDHAFQWETTGVMAITVIVIAAFSFFAARSEYFRNRPALIGLVFGFIAILTDVATVLGIPVKEGDFSVVVSIADAPSLVASFCFCPLAGLVAGIVTVFERVVLSLLKFETIVWYYSAGITLLIALYGVALRKWVFNDEPSLPLTSSIAVASAELLRFGSLVFLLPYVTSLKVADGADYKNSLIEYLNDFYPIDKINEYLKCLNGEKYSLDVHDLDLISKDAGIFGQVFNNEVLETQCLDIISHYLPYMLVGAVVAVIIAVLVSYPWKGVERRLFAIRIPIFVAFLLFGIGLAFILKFTLDGAEKLSRQTMLDACNTLYRTANDKVSFIMHFNAVSMKDSGCFKTMEEITNERLREYQDKWDVDEISVFKRNGDFVASSAYDRLNLGKKISISSVSSWKRFKDIYTEDKNVYSGTAGKFMYDILDSEDNEDNSNGSNTKKYSSHMALTFTTDEGQECILILGYSWEHVMRDCNAFVDPLLKNFRVGKYGCAIGLVEEPSGETNVFSQPFRFPSLKGKSVQETGMRPEQWRNQAGTTMTDAEICGKWYFVQSLMDEPIDMPANKKLHIVGVLPYAEHYFLATQQFSVAALALFLTCVLFNVMKIRSAKKQEIIDRMRKADLDFAFKIQCAEMQDDWTTDDKPCKICSTITPAKEVGGDFYGYSILPDGRVTIGIADVSGKGVPAAIFMMRAKFTLNNCLLAEEQLSNAVDKANRLLCENNDAKMFVTVWIGVFNPKTKELEFISAGHNAPLVKHPDGTVEWVRGTLRKKPPLAAFAKVQYQSERIQLAPGDRLFLYTDGVTEAMNEKGELYGEDRLEKTLRDADGTGALNSTIEGKIASFRGKSIQSDDITMLTMEVKQ